MTMLGVVGVVLIGSGVRRSKLLLPGELLCQLPGAEVLDGLGVPATSSTQTSKYLASGL